MTESHIATFRRRSSRSRLRTSTVVALRPMDAATPTCSGVLMNVSADGIACRVPADPAVTIEGDTLIRACFRLEQEDETYELPAVVVYRTRGGTDGYDVLGLRFMDTNDDDARRKQRLVSALRRYTR